ncbi:hypothetical protein GH714_030548 [Hevea brasiliensis]|uniref:F-box domain-containing protein n=1 Tax=Hevea brasiliensis TaxID=3981 RepID=A0A6A6N528_HEVBR|nr:hypothetical protein GH714_030548 [Hevea brasiliensis]
MESLLVRSASDQSILDDLPDHIVHNILDFVTIEDLARFSTLSRRFRRLCSSVPNLNVSAKGVETNLVKRFNFLNFIDRFMIHRDRFKLQRFSLSWSINQAFDWVFSEEYRIDSWLHQVARCDVEKLDLRIFFRESNISSYALPACLAVAACRLHICDSIGFPLKASRMISICAFSSSGRGNHFKDDGISRALSRLCPHGRPPRHVAV